MKPAAFDYHRARSVSDAVRLLVELGEDAKLLAGGQSLIPMMAFRLARPTAVIDLGQVGGLRYLRREADGLHIGALTTHREVELAGPELTGYEVLSRSMRWIGHPPIRTMGTIGGSLAHGDPTAEWGLLAVLLDAVVVTSGPRGQRRKPAGDFLFGLYATALEPDEVLVEVHFPRPAPHAALVEFAERAGDFAIVSAGVRLDLTPEGRPGGGRVLLGGVAPAPLPVDDASTLLATAAGIDDVLVAGCAEAARAAVHAIAGDSDPGETRYRADVAATLVGRALVEAAAPSAARSQP